MSYFTGKQRFKIAFGGFLLLIGFTVLILVLLIFTRGIDVENVFQFDLLVGVMVVIGSLDVLAGIILLRFQ
jgi:hypothetical protein